jgi:mono/diheme cytochrome c family protein
MSRRYRAGVVAGAVTLLVAFAGSARMASQSRPASPPQTQAPPAPQGNAALVAQGEYLANRVAMCVQCHSPRDEHGNVLMSERFHGAALPVTSPYANRPFALRAPNIAGLPGFTDDQIIMLLTEGHAGDRNPPQPPMPPFRMSRADAQAIVAYLRTF